MGLDTTHNCWHGPYSSFGAWRLALAKAVGQPSRINERWGHEEYDLPKGDWHPRNFQGWWDEDPDDPMTVLFIHSDCDGYIFPRQGRQLAERLRGITTGNAWADECTQRFAAGLEDAAESWEVVAFR